MPFQVFLLVVNRFQRWLLNTCSQCEKVLFKKRFHSLYIFLFIHFGFFIQISGLDAHCRDRNSIHWFRGDGFVFWENDFPKIRVDVEQKKKESTRINGTADLKNKFYNGSSHKKFISDESPSAWKVCNWNAILHKWASLPQNISHHTFKSR